MSADSRTPKIQDSGRGGSKETDARGSHRETAAASPESESVVRVHAPAGETSNGGKKVGGWGVFVVCECGWWDEPSFGDAWFTRTHYPVCPDCGRSTGVADTITARKVGPFWNRRLEVVSGT